MATPKGRESQGRDPKGRHLPRPHDFSEVQISVRARSPGVRLEGPARHVKA